MNGFDIRSEIQGLGRSHCYSSSPAFHCVSMQKCLFIAALTWCLMHTIHPGPAFSDAFSIPSSQQQKQQRKQRRQCGRKIQAALFSPLLSRHLQLRSGSSSHASPTRLLQAVGPDGGFSKALGIFYRGANLVKEVGSHEIDEEEAKLIEEEEEMMQERQRKEEEEEIQKDDNNQAQDKDDQQHELIENSNNTTLEGNSTGVHQEIEKVFQEKMNAFDKRARKTRIVLIRKVAAWAFEMADIEGDGRINRDAFYSGTLLVHLHFAKYFGVAACQPPTREQTDELFDLADADRSYFLNKDEFTKAVMVSTTPIASRIGIYWTLLTILPIVVSRAMGGLIGFTNQYLQSMDPSIYRKALSILEFSIQLLISRLFFSVMVPLVFDKIDKASRRYAYQRSQKTKETALWWLQFPTSGTNPKSTTSSYVPSSVSDILYSAAEKMKFHRRKGSAWLVKTMNNLPDGQKESEESNTE